MWIVCILIKDEYVTEYFMSVPVLFCVNSIIQHTVGECRP